MSTSYFKYVNIRHPLFRNHTFIMLTSYFHYVDPLLAIVLSTELHCLENTINYLCMPIHIVFTWALMFSNDIDSTAPRRSLSGSYSSSKTEKGARQDVMLAYFHTFTPVA